MALAIILSPSSSLSAPVAMENLKPRREILVQPSGTLGGPAHDSAYLEQNSVGRLRVHWSRIDPVQTLYAAWRGKHHSANPGSPTGVADYPPALAP